MLEDFLEKETLKKGLQRYLSTHAYGNARTDDLWDAMSFEVSHTIFVDNIDCYIFYIIIVILHYCQYITDYNI